MKLPKPNFLKAENYEWLIWKTKSEWLVRRLDYEVRALLPAYPLRVKEYLTFGGAVTVEIVGESLVLYNEASEKLIIPRRNNVNFTTSTGKIP